MFRRSDSPLTPPAVCLSASILSDIIFPVLLIRLYVVLSINLSSSLLSLQPLGVIYLNKVVRFCNTTFLASHTHTYKHCLSVISLIPLISSVSQRPRLIINFSS